MKVIITGATGMVGKGVLLECLDHSDITSVLSISRRSLGIEHPKLKELIHKDFTEFETVSDELTGYDACYHCMGVSAAGMSEEDYKKLTYEVSISLGKTLYKISSDMTFIYVSGVGTDSSEKGRSMWARIKGKTENDLLGLGFRRAYMFRPGGIIPLRGIQSSTRLYQFFINYFMWLLKLIKFISPNSVVNTTQIGLAMINGSQVDYEEKIIGPRDILKLEAIQVAT